jgi:hypothetical protein
VVRKLGRRSLLVGLFRLGRFRADGLDQFEGSVTAFLNSLAPLLGFALVRALLMLLHGEVRAAADDLLLTAVVLLGPLVISEKLAAVWNVGGAWLKFAVVLNWCQWTLPVVLFVCLLVSAFLVAAGWGEDMAVLAAAGVVLVYGLSLHWFLARRALGLGAGRAALLVLAMNLGTGLLAIGPRLLADGGMPG